MTDTELLTAVVSRRCEASFEKLYTQHYDFVYNTIRRVIRNRTITEELAQDAWVRVWRMRHYEVTDPTSVRALLHTMARNVAFNWLRDNNNKRYTVLHGVARAHEDHALTHLLRKADSAQLWVYIRMLPVQSQHALLLRLEEDRSIKDVARMMGITVPACKSALSRGYDKLALILRPHIDRTEEKRRNKDAR